MVSAAIGDATKILQSGESHQNLMNGETKSGMILPLLQHYCRIAPFATITLIPFNKTIVCQPC